MWATMEEETKDCYLCLWVIDLAKYKNRYKRIEHV